MKVIFLDIDGVLNSIDTLIMRDITRSMGYESTSIDDNMVERLSNIVNNTGAVIVLTSTWKNGFEFKEGNAIALDKESAILLNMFSNYGITIYDKTSNDPNGKRDSEILSWLADHYREVEDYVIIDDKYIYNSMLEPHFIKTNFTGSGELGLCDNHVERAIDILNYDLTHRLMK